MHIPGKLITTLSMALLGGCSFFPSYDNAFRGPPDLIQAGKFFGGNVCPPDMQPASGSNTPANTPILTALFLEQACASITARSDSAKAREMIWAGVLQNRMGCADFFDERAANQTGARFARKAARVSATYSSYWR